MHLKHPKSLTWVSSDPMLLFAHIQFQIYGFNQGLLEPRSFTPIYSFVYLAVAIVITTVLKLY